MKKAVGGKTALMSGACKEDGWTLEPGTLYQYQEPYGGTFSGAPNCIDRTNRIIKASKKIGNAYEAWSSPLHFLCHEHGHIAVRIPDKNTGLKEIQQSLVKCIKEFSDLMQASSKSMESGDIDKKESEKIISEGREAQQQIAAFLAQVESLSRKRG